MPAKNCRVVSTAVPTAVASALKELARRRGTTVNRLLATQVDRLLLESVDELLVEPDGDDLARPIGLELEVAE